MAQVDPAMGPAARSGGPQPKVVIAGGGCAGLETAFRLRDLLEDRAAITLVSLEDEFSFATDSIYIPFGLDPGKVQVRLSKPTQKREISLVVAAVLGLDTDLRTLETSAGAIEFDYLVIATGAGMRRDEVSGFAEHALSLGTPDYMLELAYAFRRLADEARDGKPRRVVSLLPPNCMCPGPIYELTLMLDTWLRREHARPRVELVLATHEESFFEPLGPRMHDALAEEFDERGITAHLEHAVSTIDEDEVDFANGSSLAYDLLVAYPPQVGTTGYSDLPTDNRGFIQTELETREVMGENGIYAIGDASDFPLKQSLLAFQQADAVAAHLAPRIFGRSTPGTFDPVSMDVLEQLDKGTFANVPLRLTDDLERRLAVREGPMDDYRVGTSRAWRMGKMALARAVPWRFRRGEPFHVGAFWETIETGLRGMSRVWASTGEPDE